MAVLAFEAVTRRHRVGRDTVALLDDVSFELWPGEVVAILAPRREGKTTLLRVAAGVETADAGTVRLDGEALNTLSTAERTRRLRRVGFAPKEWRVARGKPVLDHVALPMLAEGRPLVTAMTKAHEAIERVGAAHCASATTDELAAGDLARVVLAQALVRGPQLLLVDEPGAMAEADEREGLLRLLRSLAAERDGLAVVLTSRDVAGVAIASRVLTLGDGRLRGRTMLSDAAVVPFPGRSAHAAPLP